MADRSIFMEEKKFIKLPESELEVMQAIWALNAEGEKFVSAGLIMKRFPALNRLKLTTVLTLITRLQFKGFISSEKLGRSNCYKPLIDEVAYKKFVAGDFCDKVYRSNKLNMISAIVEDGGLTAEELAAVKKMIENEEAK